MAPGIFVVSARSRALFEWQRQALADGFNPGAVSGLPGRSGLRFSAQDPLHNLG